MSAPEWLGLLRWSVTHQDGTAPSQVSEMRQEDKAWLEEVMQHLVRDEVKEMTTAMERLSVYPEPWEPPAAEAGEREGEGAEQSRQEGTMEGLEMDEAMEVLRDIVEQVDMATVFVKAGGLDHIVRVLNMSAEGEGAQVLDNAMHEAVVAQLAGILASLAQNTPVNQERMLERNLLPLLAEKFAVPTTSLRLRAKLLQAMSSMVRGNAAAEREFCEAYALPVLAEAFTPACEAPENADATVLATKAAFLAQALTRSDHCDELHAHPFVPVLQRALSAAHSVALQDHTLDLWDQTLKVLHGIGRNSSAAVREIFSEPVRVSGFADEPVSVESLLQARLHNIESSDAETQEQYRHEVAPLQAALRVAAATTATPVAATTTGAGAGAGTGGAAPPRPATQSPQRGAVSQPPAPVVAEDGSPLLTTAAAPPPPEAQAAPLLLLGPPADNAAAHDPQNSNGNTRNNNSNVHSRDN